MSEARTAPTRIRLSRLQEAQLPDLVRLDAAVLNELGSTGFSLREPRKPSDFAALTRDHDVIVAEADGEVAGYLAWRDEAPGVAVVDTIAVSPELARFGVGKRLLGRLRDDAKAANLGAVLVIVAPEAPSARAFLLHAGFVAVSEDAAPVVLAHLDRLVDAQPEAQARALWLNLNDEA